MYGMRETIPDCKVHEANMEPTWVLSAPVGSHVGPMKLAIRDGIKCMNQIKMAEHPQHNKVQQTRHILVAYTYTVNKATYLAIYTRCVLSEQ